MNALTLTDAYSWLVVDGRVTHTLLYLARHCQKGLLDVGGVLGRRLEEGDAEAVCEFLFMAHRGVVRGRDLHARVVER